MHVFWRMLHSTTSCKQVPHTSVVYISVASYGLHALYKNELRRWSETTRGEVGVILLIYCCVHVSEQRSGKQSDTLASGRLVISSTSESFQHQWTILADNWFLPKRDSETLVFQMISMSRLSFRYLVVPLSPEMQKPSAKDIFVLFVYCWYRRLMLKRSIKY